MTDTTIKVFSPYSASSKSNCSSDLKSCTGTDIGGSFWKRELAKIEARKARREKKQRLFTHPALKLFTQAQLLKLQKNFSKNNAIIQHSPNTIDFKPVVKLFTPDANCTWLLSELSPDLIAFALCDLGLGEPEMGYVCLKEIHALRGRLGLPVERDRWFVADKALTEYANIARAKGRIDA